MKAQTSLRIRTVSPEPSLFAHMKYESRRRFRPKIRHLAPLDGCACAFEEWVYGGQKVPWHGMAQLVNNQPSTHLSSGFPPLTLKESDGTFCMLWFILIVISATSWQNQQYDCAPSEDSDQPGHPPRLIRVFAVRSMAQWVAKDPSFLHADSKDSDQTGRMPFC